MFLGMVHPTMVNLVGQRKRGRRLLPAMRTKLELFVVHRPFKFRTRDKRLTGRAVYRDEQGRPLMVIQRFIGTGRA